MNNNLSHSCFRHAHVAIAAACGLIAGFAPFATADAQQWTIAPEIKVGGEYDDNGRLQSDEAEIQEIDGYLLEGSLGIAYATERTIFDLTPRLRSSVYDETPDVDSDDQFLDLGFNHKTLRSEFDVHGSYSRESVRTAERTDEDIDVDDPDEIPTDGTGLVFDDDRRSRFVIAPEWSYDIGERTSLGARLQFMDVSYDGDEATSRVGYTDQRAAALLSRSLTERTRGYIAVSARQFENDRGTNEVDGLGGGIGFESDISETTQLRAEVGYEETTDSETDVSDSNIVGNISLIRRFETVRILAQYKHDVGASGSGRVTQRDSLGFNLKKQFTERVSGGIGVRATQTDALDDLGDQAVAFEERDFTRVFAQLEVALSQAFWVEAQYSHDEVERSGTEGSADSNSYRLWLVYRPTPIVK
jgi:hypothetical protein